MTLRRTLQGYLVGLHLVIAVVLAGLMWAEHRPWILVLELGVLMSGLIGWWLIRGLAMPDELARIGAEWMREGDFSHTIRPAGTADLQELVGLFNELFHRLRDERIRLREQNLLLDKVIMASPSGMLTTDHDGRIQLVNPTASRMLELSAEDLSGFTVTEILPATEELAVGESRIIVGAGGRRLRWSRAQFFDRGFPREFFLIEDLTHELWATEKRAYHALIRTLSHEVNNTLGATGSILRSVLAYGHQLEAGDRQDFTSALTVAVERGENLVAFMKRYAEVVRVPQPVKRATNLVDMLRHLIQLFGPECEGREITLKFEAPAEDFQIALDVVQMERVLVNVLRNAVEAVDHNGWIRVDLKIETEGARLRVIDSGPGLSAEACRHLFTPFFSTKAEGQGVGLTLVREILTQHGLEFDLESPPDGPTCFWINLGFRSSP
ncbi:MAG: PAS domain-containing protein [Thermoanaerobaculales bacterium]|nr:PAS domain-containing protein [Thermoanaerobaculales bacterium]